MLSDPPPPPPKSKILCELIFELLGLPFAIFKNYKLTTSLEVKV